MFSIIGIFNTLLRFPEKSKILVRQPESKDRELHNQRGKIYASFIRQDALDIPLTGIVAFLPWYDRLNKVLSKCGNTLDQSILLGQIKRSIKNPSDSTSIKSMTGLNQVVTYLKGKYKMDPKLAVLSLSNLKELKIPQDSIELSIKNISVVLPRLKLLEAYNLLGKLHRGVLSALEGKCFTCLRLQLYNCKKSKVLDAEREKQYLSM